MGIAFVCGTESPAVHHSRLSRTTPRGAGTPCRSWARGRAVVPAMGAVVAGRSRASFFRKTGMVNDARGLRWLMMPARPPFPRRVRAQGGAGPACGVGCGRFGSRGRLGPQVRTHRPTPDALLPPRCAHHGQCLCDGHFLARCLRRISHAFISTARVLWPWRIKAFPCR
jgi:hypothetical protein